MIKEIKTGEIIRINNKDYIIKPNEKTNGRDTWTQPDLIQLEHLIKPTPKKWRGCPKTIYPFRKFKGIKLKVLKGGNKGK